MSRLAAAAVIVVASLAAVAQAAPPGPPPPPLDVKPYVPAPGALVRIPAKQDHQRLLGMLLIKSLRPGAERASANGDESKANPFPALPDPLRTKAGKPVTTPAMWWQTRRQEIADDVEGSVYGHLPETALRFDFKPVSTTPEIVGRIAAVTRLLVARRYAATRPPLAVETRLTLTMPAAHKAPVPIVLVLANGDAKGSWREQVLAKGWGLAVLDAPSVQPDTAWDLTHGVIGAFKNGHVRTADDWGVLRAWSWGASRAMDYFESDLAIDSGHVAIAGQGDFGKAALLAMAYDARFTVALISSSGRGGASLLRRNFGERLENLAGVSGYHLFTPAFLRFAGPNTAKDLPVDTHDLFALAAPRPIFVAEGTDTWSDPRGSFLAAAAATPVYRLLGKTGLAAGTMPPAGKVEDKGELAFRQRSAKETADADWSYFLKFAERFMKPAKPR
jgi:hypothetical protein